MSVLFATQGPFYAPFMGFAGVSMSLILCNLGSAYGTAKSGVAIGTLGMKSPSNVTRNLIPVIMAGILGIYGLIVAIIINQKILIEMYSGFQSFSHFAAGLCCGVSSLGAGMAIGIVGDYSLRANGEEPLFFVPMVIMLIFGEALGLYGLIVGVLLASKGAEFQNITGTEA